MPDYVEIEDPRLLRRLASALSVNLKAKLVFSESRDVGDPSGTYRREVHFQSAKASGIFWSSRCLAKEPGPLSRMYLGAGRRALKRCY